MNPDLAAFLALFGAELVFGQVLINPTPKGFELRHIQDRGTAPESLELLTPDKLRDLAQYGAQKVFRPLKSAPNLRSGWRCHAVDADELYAALGALYPGAVADWFAAQSKPPPVTSYRQFTERQTGMYRITTHLNDTVASAAIRACCHVDFCLKRRLWTVEGLPPDAADQKSLIPCLEPCAVMLEFARKVARWEQQGTPPESPPQPESGETDFDASNNPRRVRFFAEKQQLASGPR